MPGDIDDDCCDNEDCRGIHKAMEEGNGIAMDKDSVTGNDEVSRSSRLGGTRCRHERSEGVKRIRRVTKGAPLCDACVGRGTERRMWELGTWTGLD